MPRIRISGVSTEIASAFNRYFRGKPKSSKNAQSAADWNAAMADAQTALASSGATHGASESGCPPTDGSGTRD